MSVLLGNKLSNIIGFLGHMFTGEKTYNVAKFGSSPSIYMYADYCMHRNHRLKQRTNKNKNNFHK